MRFINLLIFLFCFLFSISCTSLSKDNRLYTYLTDDAKFILLPPEAIERQIDMVQHASYEFRGQNYFLIAWVKADKNAIEMVFLNELGASIGELSYKEDSVKFTSSVIPKSVIRYIKPEYIVADFQLCFYDPLLLKQALEDNLQQSSGLVFEIQNNSRRILNGDEIIIEITKTEKTVRLVNHLRKYAYTLEGDFHDII